MSNPWLPDQWNLTAQGQFVLQYGLVKAEAAAAEAGTTLGGKPKQDPNNKVIERHWIIRKVAGGGAAGGKGFSGTGVPGETV